MCTREREIIRILAESHQGFVREVQPFIKIKCDIYSDNPNWTMIVHGTGQVERKENFTDEQKKATDDIDNVINCLWHCYEDALPGFVTGINSKT